MSKLNSQVKLGQKKILFVTNVVSPFWIEFAKTVEKYTDIKFSIAFSERKHDNRGSHWSDTPIELENHFIFDGEDYPLWINKIVDNLSPSIIVGGGITGAANNTVFEIAKKNNITYGIIAEQPNPKNKFLNLLNLLFYKYILFRRKPEFFLAIGDRAFDIYKRIIPKSCKIAIFPYHQNLQYIKARRKLKSTEPMRFLFSGRLLERNSIEEMTKAFEMLAIERPGRFVWCVSAHGSEEKWINEALARSNGLAKSTYFDRDFKNWSERLRPFAESDVLVLPSKHSGWGLVIPEALAAGLPVITTRYVEAARYFIDDMSNGIFIEPTTSEIYKALVFCVDNYDVIEGMKINARASAFKGGARYGSRRLDRLIKKWDLM